MIHHRTPSLPLTMNVSRTTRTKHRTLTGTAKKHIFSGSYRQSHALQASKQAERKVDQAKQRRDELQGKCAIVIDIRI